MRSLLFSPKKLIKFHSDIKRENAEFFLKYPPVIERLCKDLDTWIPVGQFEKNCCAAMRAVLAILKASTAVAIALSLFAFSTILGWGVYGGRTAEYVFGEKAAVPYKIIYCLFVAAGAVIDLKLVWDISDTLNGLMSIPNLIGVLLLSPVVVKLAKEYFADK